MRCRAVLAITLLLGVIYASPALAITRNLTATVSFATALTLTKVSDIDFGVVQASTAGTYTINTTGTVTASGGGQTLGGSTQAGNISIVGSGTQSINISAGNYSANNGVTPSNATCSYNGAAAGACSLNGQAPPSAAGKTLLVGVRVVANGTQAGGTTAAPTFDITVVYQ